MAEITGKNLRSQVIYQIFVRNFSEEGTFRAVIPALDRIREMGVDFIWFAPICPIGEKNRKGSLGSPYAIRDYRAVDPAYGTMEDFDALVEAIHARGMKCLIDMVYNHTSPDSVLAAEHPEWFYHQPDGSFGNQIAEWTDVIDLDYTNRALWDYQIETLCQWAQRVDGFRCDAAPMIPVAFWMEARAAVEKVRPGAVWLCESIEPGFIRYLRSRGMTGQSDSEMYRAFDLCYDYDAYPVFTDYLSGNSDLSAYVRTLNRQETIYPENYVKLRFLENHDVPRARFLFPELPSLIHATALLFFLKGTTLLYAGQERGIAHLPNLFEKDPVRWDETEGTDISGLIKRLSALKREPVFAEGLFSAEARTGDFLVGEYRWKETRLLGIFSLKGAAGPVSVSDVPEGMYVNEIDGAPVEVRHGMVSIGGGPVIFYVKRPKAEEPLEIERKFLIRYPDFTALEALCTGKAELSQTYLISEKSVSRRIRKATQNGKTVYWYNEKERITDMTRIEREHEITRDEYEKLQKEAIPDARTIRKTRYFLPSGEHCFEIDVFPEWDDRAFAEVELKTEGEAFLIPDCLEVIKEVTQDKRYTNAALAKHGFVYE